MARANLAALLFVGLTAWSASGLTAQPTLAGELCLQVTDRLNGAGGMALAAVDTDHDGKAELAIGAPSWDWSAGELDNGMFQTREPGDPGSYVGDGVSGLEGSRFGDAVVHADFNGDGEPEFAISAPADGGGTVTVRGRCGPTCWGPITTLRQGVDGLADISEDGDDFGSILAAGDFDNDGFDDLAVGVQGEDWSGVAGIDQGAVHIVYGGLFGLTGARDLLLGEHDLGALREDGDDFGLGLAAGDLDGDGYDDLAIGAPGEDYGNIFQAGMAFVVFGSADGLDPARRQIWTQASPGIADSPEINDLFGQVLAIADLDRVSLFSTSRGDLIIGASGESDGSHPGAGTVHVLYSDANGPSATGSLQLFRPGGSLDHARFGVALLAARFGTDAAADLVVGAPQVTYPDTTRTGEVHLFLGTAGGPLVSSGNAPWRPIGEPCAGDAPEARQFGAMLVGGDFNADGRRDLGIGIPEWSPTEPGERFGAVAILFGTPMLYSDGFETGTTARWSAAVP